ncbi:MAG TPA: tRNA (adenosine(37)-N6)-threonylcarbamoyltransferase complex transferase subunit TsaD [Candidatus Acidoferrales bacterium]|jgi:N6-L-threonylcarbamoyladenine synthase|nr:tRNA (adenosine(37)-N6)-threonylcarbamoyltransferase complex transferase subunit TsaD [Candidatus Acidoferrales bacterium]
MTLLALETSCDETSAAVVRDGKVLANVVSSQIKLHAEYGGVVPELAAREHLSNLLPVAQSALREAGVSAAGLDAVAATQGPGLAIALLVGFKAAQSVAFALNRPFIGINHHEAHLYSPWISGEPAQADFKNFQRNISLIVSGGHTMLVLVESELKHRVLGGTIDDAAGECFDKTGKLMGLAYPAGPVIDRLAEQGNPKAYDFPRPLLHEANDDFSFSGLKTSVRYFIRDNPTLLDDPQKVRDLCASVQAAIVEVLVKKTVRTAKREGVKCITASGGVTCNRGLRNELERACKKNGFTLRLADKQFCTDNAAMIGILAERKLLAGVPLPSLDEEINPGWVLA